LQKLKPLKNLILLPEEKIIKAMHRLNKLDFKFQLIVSNEGKFLGTVTDGDIRRAIMKGFTSDSPITDCMNKSPSIGRVSSPSKYYKLFDAIPALLKFLPVVDNSNILKFILVKEYIISNKTVLIMAGGFGKRLGNKTKNIPKPLLKIGNEPMLETLLKKLEESNFQKIYISTFYLHEKIEKFIKKRLSKSNIKIIREDKPLGTAGCISLVPKEDRELLMVINADVISDIDFESISLFHSEKVNDITVTVAKYSHQIQFGIVNIDKNLNFKSLKEKPILEHFILSGIYCLNNKICNLVKNEYLDMTSLIEKAHMLGSKVGIFPIYEYWQDVGNKADFEKVHKSLHKRKYT
jgi:dTDP-glucose pyrophosphorylase